MHPTWHKIAPQTVGSDDADDVIGRRILVPFAIPLDTVPLRAAYQFKLLPREIRSQDLHRQAAFVTLTA